jgi:queuine/archaeosine tRNA-ribosyltransferase
VFSLGKQVGTVKDGLKGKQKKRYHKDASCLVSLKEAGAVFRSYRNGETITLTPESSVRFQRAMTANALSR